MFDFEEFVSKMLEVRCLDGVSEFNPKIIDARSVEY